MIKFDYKKLTLKRRIQLNFLISILLVAIIGIISFRYFALMTQEVNSLINKDTFLLTLSEELRCNFIELRRVEQNYINSYDEEILNKHNNIVKEILLALEKAQSIGLKEKMNDRYRKLEKLTKDYQSLFSKFTLSKGVAVTDKIKILEEIESLYDQILFLTQEITEDRLAELNSYWDKAKEIPGRAIKSIVTIALLLIFSGLILGLLSTHKIIFPFKRFHAVLQEVKNCNLNTRIEIEGDDEFAQLAEDINKVLSQIKMFDELKTERILLEKQKFDHLSNMIEKKLILCDKDRKIHHLNNAAYNFFGLTSSIFNTDIVKSGLPLKIIEIVRRSLEKDERVPKHQITVFEDEKDKDKKHIEIETTLVRDRKGITQYIITIFQEIPFSGDLEKIEESTQ